MAVLGNKAVEDVSRDQTRNEAPGHKKLGKVCARGASPVSNAANMIDFGMARCHKYLFLVCIYIHTLSLCIYVCVSIGMYIYIKYPVSS